MQTQQVNAAAGALFFGRVSASVAEKTTDASFEQMFQTSSEKYDTKDVSEQKVKKDTTVSQTDSTDHMDKLSEEKTMESTETNSGSEVDKKVSETKVSDAEQTKDADNAELAERAAGLVNQILDVVKDMLNLTEEQMKSTMDLLGMKEVDLLNVDMLKQMVLVVNGEQDMAAFLTDGNLLSELQELTDAVQQMIAESGLNPDELAIQLEDNGFVQLVQNALEEPDHAESELSIEENIHGKTESAETQTVKETEISFKTEARQTEHAESGEDAGKDADFKQNESPFADQFIQNLQKAVTEGVQNTSLRSDLAAQIREIADQILEKVKMTITPEMTSLEVQLTPEHLGKVSVTVSEQDGVMKASFVTENELAKEAIESNLIQFKEMMNEQGIKVETIEVMVSDFSFDKNGQAGQSEQNAKQNNKSRFVVEEDKETVATQDELALHFMEGGESTVNYMA